MSAPRQKRPLTNAENCKNYREKQKKTSLKKSEEELEKQRQRKAYNQQRYRDRIRAKLDSIKLTSITLTQKAAAPIYSNAIKKRKSDESDDLRIVRMSLATGKMSGGDEMILLVEKVNENDIKIRFYEMNTNGEEIWEAYAEFNEYDVHHQYAIICQTPAYKNPENDEPVKVFIELVRPSDEKRSEKMKEPFTYKPMHHNNEKRRKMYSSCGSLKSDNIPNVISNLSEISVSLLGEPGSNLNSEKNSHKSIFNGDEGLLPKDGIISNDSRSYGKPTTAIRSSSDLSTCFEAIKKLYTKSIGDPLSDKDKIKSEIIRLYKSYSSSNPYGDSLVHDIILKSKFILNYAKLGTNIYKVLEKLQLNSLLSESLNGKNESVLHCACLTNAPEFIRLSLRAGCSPNIKDKRGNTPLHLAVTENHLNCVECLLKTAIRSSSLKSSANPDENGIECDLSIKNDDGLTPLHLAIKQGSFDISQLLLKTNGSISKERCSKDGNNALHLAVIGKSPDLVQIILEQSPTLEIVNDVNNANLTPIQLAKLHSSPTMENERIIKIISPFQSDTDDMTIKEETFSSTSSDEDDAYSGDKEFISNDGDHEITHENSILLQNFKKCLRDCNLLSKLLEHLNEKDRWKVLVSQSDHSYLLYLCTDATSLIKQILTEDKISDFAIIFKDEIKEVLK